MVVMEKINDFLKTDFAGQFVDVIAGINQLADIAFNVAQAGGGRHHAFQPFRKI